mmetsp:Transcript_43679/g.103089  ORF Transcript_43679/g.103089 Transcript_43679/m.103089 type:complete len:689 (+) Transcript_43679:94-2160(+)
MHGLIHVVLKGTVLRHASQQAWLDILALLEVQDEAEILQLEQYGDEVTLAGVEAATKVLGVELGPLMKLAGAQFVRHVAGEEHTAWLLGQLGDTMPEFLAHLNHLHQVIERKHDYRDCDFPVFKVERMADMHSREWYLSYSSSRGDTLQDLVEGVVVELGRVLFRSAVTMRVLEIPKPNFVTTWCVSISPLAEPDLPPEQETQVSEKPNEEVKPEGCQQCGSSALSFHDWHAALISLLRPSEGKVLASTEAEKKTTTAMSWEEAELGAIERALAANPPNPADYLMRSIPLRHVAAEWDQSLELEKSRVFWASNVGDFNDYALSRSRPRADRFVTHAWTQPQDWQEVMGKKTSYASLKAISLALVAQDIVGEAWSDLTVWIDKACIPQQHPLVPTCVNLIEEFIKRCDGMIVILTWHYFSRLWCVYEWAAFLVHKPPTSVRLCVDLMLRPETVHLYTKCVRNFSVSKAECFNEADRAIVQAKIAEYYNSTEAFEKFVKGTAIALFARVTARPAGRGRSDEEELFQPWQELAEELGYDDLQEALYMANPSRWKQMSKSHHLSAATVLDLHEGPSGLTKGDKEVKSERSVKSVRFGQSQVAHPSEGSEANDSTMLGPTRSTSKVGRSWQGRFIEAVDVWFDEAVVPVLDALRQECVKPEHWQSVHSPRPSPDCSGEAAFNLLMQDMVMLDV